MLKPSVLLYVPHIIAPTDFDELDCAVSLSIATWGCDGAHAHRKTKETSRAERVREKRMHRV